MPNIILEPWLTSNQLWLQYFLIQKKTPDISRVEAKISQSYLTASLSALPGLNAGTLLAGIWIS